ncbi:MAG: urea transporter [Paludibacter sp.]|nr:urea transporter [Paludibacter sp.]
MIKRPLYTFRTLILPAILNSYSVVFFFNNKLLACVLMLVSFFNFFAGLSGLLAVVMAVLIANSMNLDKVQLKKGLFSFNALLTGIGMGTFFDPSPVFFTLLALAALLTLMISVTLSGWMNKYGLPVLSLPFVITFWFIVLPSAQFENLGLTQRNIYWMNEMYAMGGTHLLNLFQSIDTLPVHNMVDIYLRSMSSIIFQNNLVAGILIALCLLICSRIAFSLSIVGFLSAYFFAQFSGSAATSITYYNIGANYIMVALAVGGFFIIPSRYSYLWTVLLVPVTTLVLLFFSKLLGFIHLPVFSLPFSLTVILFIYFLQYRNKASKLVLTPFQYYSPEINLYTYNNNNKDRQYHFLYFPLYLPFWGEWTVSQGHDGKHTHKGEWGKAYDFILLDDESKSFNSNGLLCDNYYCYNKPVIAPADGVVEEIIDHIDDNEIGKVDTANNWGNTIIIRHLTGLYTQLSHLRKGSFKVAKGDFVKRGDLLASCGNSGRSPEPHIHFQAQMSPAIGSRTLDYPFAYYHQIESDGNKLIQFSKPEEGSKVSGVIDNPLLKNAFDIMPNSTFAFKYLNEKEEEVTEEWEAFTDAYNYKYLYCKETESSAYYVNDSLMFYFTAFYGNKKSLLYYFYLTAYKVFLGNPDHILVKDAMPLNIIRNRKLSLWIHDFIAPFYNYIRVLYSIKIASAPTPLETGKLELESDITVSVFGNSRKESIGSIFIENNSITGFNYESAKTQIHATCINS